LKETVSTLAIYRPSMTLVYLDLIVSFIVVAIVGLPTVLGLAILFN